MNNLNYVIYFFFAAIVSFGLLLIFVKNLVHAVFCFLGILISIVALFILAQAEFVGVTQLLVYVGGIIILVLFGTMLTYDYSQNEKPSFDIKNIVSFVSILIFGWFIYLVFYPSLGKKLLNATFEQPKNAIQQIGFNLMTNFVFMFELSGILLLATLIGALFIISRPKK